MHLVLKLHYERVRATENASRDPSYLLERRHGLAEIVERGVGVVVERHCVIRPNLSKSGAIVDESRAGVHDDLMRVPGKPLGFLAASTIEYHPARPEAHRSTVLAGQKLHSSRPPKPRELPVKVSLRHK